MYGIMLSPQNTKHIQGACTMNSIAFDGENEKHFSSKIHIFFRRYQISGISKRCSASKSRVPVVTLIQYLFCPVFRNRRMFLDMQSENYPCIWEEWGLPSGKLTGRRKNPGRAC